MEHSRERSFSLTLYSALGYAAHSFHHSLEEKQMIVNVRGHWLDLPTIEYSVLVSLGSWDGQETEEDRNIFYYTDGEPLSLGDVIAGDFRVTEIY